MLKPHLYSVNGRDYATLPMPATESLRVLPTIIRLLGHELTELMLVTADATGEKGIESLLSNREVMARAISVICENAGHEGGLVVLRDLMRHTTMTAGDGVVNVYEHFDELFAGDVFGMLTVAVQALRCSFTRPSAG